MKFYAIDCQGSFLVQRVAFRGTYSPYKGRIAYDESNNTVYYGTGSTWVAIGSGGGGGGASSFIDLTDVPNSYSGQAGKKLVVKAGQDGMEFEDDNLASLSDIDLTGQSDLHLLQRTSDGSTTKWRSVYNKNLFCVNDYSATPAVSPSAGDVYLVASGATGAWSGQANKIAYYTGSGWTFSTAATDSVVITKNINGSASVKIYIKGASSWTEMSLSISGVYTTSQVDSLLTNKQNILRTVEVKTNNYTVQTTDVGKIFKVTHATTPTSVTFTLPTSPTEGFYVTLIKLTNCSSLSVTRGGTNTIVDTSTTITNDAADEIYANITLLYISDTGSSTGRWIITSAHGTWVTS